ncbi:hypothetical protein, partial [Burkholderia contaminans]|uniref:hypothetical protein n=1 Tax=Burkholderia contaminans TaxID=488447 RepID=UPI0031128F7D
PARAAGATVTDGAGACTEMRNPARRKVAEISVSCRCGKRFTAMARFLLVWCRPRNGCALPDDIPDKEDSP